MRNEPNKQTKELKEIKKNEIIFKTKEENEKQKKKNGHAFRFKWILI